MNGPPPPFGFPGGPPGMPMPRGPRHMPPGGMMPFAPLGAPMPMGPGMMPPFGGPRPMFRPGMNPMMMPPGAPMLPRPGMGPTTSAPPQLVQKSTIVYVGKIAASLVDSVLKSLLEACGPVKSWKRVEDPDTKQPKGFGFCEFEDAEGVLRAIRVLNDLKVDGQALLLKCNTATQKYIDMYEQQAAKEKQDKERQDKEKQAEDRDEGEIQGEVADKDGDEDNKVLERIMSILSEREDNLQKQQAATEQAKAFLATLDKEEKQKHKSKAKEVAPEKVKDRAKEKEEEKKQKEREKELEREFERERERQRKEEEAQRREAERVYEQRLKEWERFERERLSLRDKEKERQKELERERARAIRAELEASDTDDDLEPWQRRPYRTSRKAEERRKRRLKEEEEDDADRTREEQELEVIKKQRQELEQAQRLENGQMDMDFRSNQQELPPPPKLEPDFDPEDPIYKAMIAAAQERPVKRPSPSPPPPAFHHAVKQEPVSVKPESPPPQPAAAKPAARQKVLNIFGDDDEEESKPRKLKPIKYSEEELKAVQPTISNQEKMAMLKKIMDKIPSSKEGVFEQFKKFDWGMYDAKGVGDKVSGWVSKKVSELLGAPEPDLVNFITAQLGAHLSPPKMLEELRPVLDKDAELFVIKLYRTVIYEAEKAQMGL